jgi:hypothetical protein
VDLVFTPGAPLPAIVEQLGEALDRREEAARQS